MNAYVKTALSAAVAAVIAGTGVALTALTDAGEISQAGLLGALLTAAAAAAKDVQAALMKTGKGDA